MAHISTQLSDTDGIYKGRLFTFDENLSLIQNARDVADPLKDGRADLNVIPAFNTFNKKTRVHPVPEESDAIESAQYMYEVTLKALVRKLFTVRASMIYTDMKGYLPDPGVADYTSRMEEWKDKFESLLRKLIDDGKLTTWFFEAKKNNKWPLVYISNKDGTIRTVSSEAIGDSLQKVKTKHKESASRPEHYAALAGEEKFWRNHWPTDGGFLGKPADAATAKQEAIDISKSISDAEKTDYIYHILFESGFVYGFDPASIPAESELVDELEASINWNHRLFKIVKEWLASSNNGNTMFPDASQRSFETVDALRRLCKKFIFKYVLSGGWFSLSAIEPPILPPAPGAAPAKTRTGKGTRKVKLTKATPTHFTLRACSLVAWDKYKREPAEEPFDVITDENMQEFASMITGIASYSSLPGISAASGKGTRDEWIYLVCAFMLDKNLVRLLIKRTNAQRDKDDPRIHSAAALLRHTPTDWKTDSNEVVRAVAREFTPPADSFGIPASNTNSLLHISDSVRIQDFAKSISTTGAWIDEDTRKRIAVLYSVFSNYLLATTEAERGSRAEWFTERTPVIEFFSRWKKEEAPASWYAYWKIVKDEIEGRGKLEDMELQADKDAYDREIAFTANRIGDADNQITMSLTESATMVDRLLNEMRKVQTDITKFATTFVSDKAIVLSDVAKAGDDLMEDPLKWKEEMKAISESQTKAINATRPAAHLRAEVMKALVSREELATKARVLQNKITRDIPAKKKHLELLVERFSVMETKYTESLASYQDTLRGLDQRATTQLEETLAFWIS
jgi:hypothetical protein